MCLGIPMQVVSSDGLSAVCRRPDAVDGGVVNDGGEGEVIDIRLIGPVEPGQWVLTFLGAARSVLSAEDAEQTLNALTALSVALDGGNVDHLFADLIDHEPQLPPHLRAQTS